MSGTDRIFGLSWDEIQAAQQGKPYRRKVLMTPCDYGSDPLPDGMFRMVPSGDVVSKEERDATSFADIMNALPYFLNRYGGGNER